MSKLVSEADRLLEKGKYPEAIAKLQEALKAEPLNQLLATKLANVHLESGDPEKAGKVYIAMASRLSEAGKPQVAIAVYKQALEINPSDVDLKVKYAIECEAVGKIGDAQTQGQMALQHFLRRKKYFDAANLMPLLVRINPKDEKLKMAWLEIMQLSQAEQKLVHLLVAFCGPPGLVSQEFSVGGEPTALSEPLYEGLKMLVPFFPRDPKVAYAAAWCAHRRGREKDFYTYLHECIRREPDFCLGLLLYARTLSEQQKLNESLFVYKHLKGRLVNDKTVDMLTLNRLVEGFVEKNGWIAFSDGMGMEDLSAEGFLRSVAGATEQAAPSAPPPVPGPSAAPVPGQIPVPPGIKPPAVPSPRAPAPAPAPVQTSPVSEQEVPEEIELSLSPPESEGDMELLLTNNQSKPMPAAAPVASPPPSALEPGSAVPQDSAPAPMEPAKEQPLAETTGTVEFTSMVPVPQESPEAEPEAPPPAAAVSPAEIPPAAAETLPESPPPAPKRPTFNPLEQMEANQQASGAPTQQELNERTQMFSPVDLLGASNLFGSEIPDVNTKAILQKQTDLALPANTGGPEQPPAPPQTYQEEGRSQEAPGEGTMLYSPVEAVQAAQESRRPHTKVTGVQEESPPPAHTPVAPEAPPKPPPVSFAPIPPAPGVPGATFQQDLQLPPMAEEGENADATQIMASPQTKSEAASMPLSFNPPSMTATEVFTDPLDALARADGEATVFISRQEAVPPAQEPPSDESPRPEGDQELISGAQDNDQATTVMGPDALAGLASEGLPPEEIPEEIPPGAPQRPIIKFQKMPEFATKADIPGKAGISPLPEEEIVDLGDDLLDGPTRLIFQEKEVDATAHLLKEIKKEVGKNKAPARKDEYMLKKAERYIAKRNYYLARKALRHSLALGADENIVKAKLREIRKLEFPESLYHTISSDEPSGERSSEILDRLEAEFNLQDENGETEGRSLSASIESQLDLIFKESDARTILDFGVAVHEMGLYRQAEEVFSRMVDQFPEVAFDAYYLAAVAKFSRKDYAGAASILKKLSTDARPEDQKIQVYYALGELFEKMQRPERSKEFFRKVAELDSNYRNIRHKLED